MPATVHKLPLLSDKALTYFAPAGRDDGNELHRKANVVGKTVWLTRVLDAMPNMVMVVNRNRQIVAANESLRANADHCWAAQAAVTFTRHILHLPLERIRRGIIADGDRPVSPTVSPLPGCGGSGRRPCLRPPACRQRIGPSSRPCGALP